MVLESNDKIVASSSPLLTASQPVIMMELEETETPLNENVSQDENQNKNIEIVNDKVYENENDNHNENGNGNDNENSGKKLLISGLPKFSSNKDIKKYVIGALAVSPEDLVVRKNPKWDFAYVTLRGDALKIGGDLESSLDKFENSLFKNKVKTRVSVVNAMDPEKSKNTNSKRNSNRNNEKADKSVADCVAPLRHMTYEEQLVMKQKTLANTINSKFYREMPVKLSAIPQMLPTLASPLTSEYRNKSEFCIGYNGDGAIIVGYKKGSYNMVGNTVESPEGCEAVSPKAHLIAAKLAQDFLSSDEGKSMGLPYFANGNSQGTGLWRILRVRSIQNGQMMLGFQIHPEPLSRDPSLYEKIKLSIINVYKDFSYECTLTKTTFRVTHILLQQSDQRSTVMDHSRPFDLILGNPEHLTETLMGLKFNISIESFFQVNAGATKVLYSKVKDLLFSNDEIPTSSEHGRKKPVLLDICSGTGTIGQIMSDSVEKVIGIELIKEAVDDANATTKLNGIENATFICGKVEDKLGPVLKSLTVEPDREIIAILDPPRSGCPKSVIRSIRERDDIKRVIYVSCSAEQASINFVQLCRPTSNAFPGIPFKPTLMQPVDLFPNTKHCELIIVFDRSDNSPCQSHDAAEANVAIENSQV